MSDPYRPAAIGADRLAPLSAVLIGVVIVTALYFGREVLVPIALALLLSFVLAPPVRLLQRCHVPRIVAVLVVGLVAFATTFSLGALMVAQVTQLAGDLPGYQTTLREKIRSVRGAAGGPSTLERASEVLQDLGKEIDRPKGEARAPLSKDGGAAGRPILVEVRQPDPGALKVLATLIAPLTSPLTTAGIVVIFVIFILIQRQDLRNRLVRLAGARDLQRTTAALDDAGQRLSRLFLSQLALNAAFGLVIGLGLWLIGVPRAPLWGVLAMVMRFVPYVGAVISAIFPILLAAAVGSGWSMLLMTVALFLIVEAVVGHAIEPLVSGHSTGLSPVAVVISATFWTWLWGPIGLILATPLTMCLVVLGRHIDQLKFLEIMFGDEPPLTPAELIYQRMLAGDPVEAAEQAEAFLKEKPLAAYYDEILLEGLRLAQADAERGLLDQERMQRIRNTVAEIVDDLASHADQPEIDEQAQASASDKALAGLEKSAAARVDGPSRQQASATKPVLCIPGPSLLDEAAATMIVHLLERKGIGARAEDAQALSMSRMFSWEIKDVALICLCYVEHATPAQIRYAIRRVRRRIPDVAVVVALFGDAEHSEQADDPTADFVPQSLRKVVARIDAIISEGAGTAALNPAIAATAR